MSKPKKLYSDLAGGVVKGERALLFLPGFGWVSTSAVVSCWPTPQGPGIETLNTIYVPFENDDPTPIKIDFEEILKCAA